MSKKNKRQEINIEKIIREFEKNNSFSEIIKPIDISVEAVNIPVDIPVEPVDIPVDVSVEPIDIPVDENQINDYPESEFSDQIQTDDIIIDFAIDEKTNEYIKTADYKNHNYILPGRKMIRTANESVINYFDWIGSAVKALVLVAVFFIFAVRIVNVSGESMLNTLKDKERVILTDLIYEPQLGDIVVIKKGSHYNKILIKRIIATAGQSISIDPKTGEVAVDNVIIEENYIKDLTKVVYDVQYPLFIPEGYVFVMGDNRMNSKDSRDSSVGLIKTEDIIGKATAIIYPFKDIRLINYN